MASGRRRSNTYSDGVPYRSAPRDEAYPTSTNYYDTQPPPYNTYDTSSNQYDIPSGGRTYKNGGYTHDQAGQPAFAPPPEQPVKRSKSHKHGSTAKTSVSDKGATKGYAQYMPQFDRAKATARTKSFGKTAFNKVGDAVEAYAAAQGYSQPRETAQPRRGRSEAPRYDDPYDPYHLPRKYSHGRGDRDRGHDRGSRRYSSPSPSPPRHRGKKKNDSKSYYDYDYDGRPVPRRPEHNRRQSFSLSPSSMRRRRDPSPEAARGRRRPDYARQPSYSVSPPPRNRRQRGPLDHSPEDYMRGRGKQQSDRRRQAYSLSPSPDRYDRRSRKYDTAGKPDKYAAGGADKFGRSKSSNPTDAQRRWQLAAAAALKAGGATAFRMRNQPGNWAGDKGVRVATAALSAAAMDAFMKGNDPQQQKKKGMRDQAQSAIGGLLASQLMAKAGGGGGGGKRRY